MNSFLETLKQLGPSRLGIMGAILVGLLLFFVFVSMRISTPDMKLLYSDLTSADSAAIAAKLEAAHITYDVSGDGTRIMAPEADVGRARLLVASAGLPNGGSMGYEIFDQQSSFGTTNFVQNINQVRALEGELARTISSIQGVRSARVHLVLPQRELFSRDKEASTAAVFLNVRPGAALEAGQIAAVQSLVASAVPDLKASNVSVIDSSGKLLAQGSDDQSTLATMKTDEMRRNYEARLADKIEDQVGRVVGFGKVRATVTANINFDQISTNEEVYDPNGQVLRSTQTSEEDNKETQASSNSDVSVQNNLPGAQNLLNNASSPNTEGKKTEETQNYEISKTVRNTVREVGDIKKLSIAVLVDGSYDTTKDDKGKETKTYKPRSAEEITHITDLVKSSAGFDEKRGDAVQVVNMQFASVDTDEKTFVDDRLLFGFEKNKLIDMAEIVTVAIMIILLVLQPMLNRLLAFQPPEIDEQLEADLLAPRMSNPALAAPEYGGQDDGEPEKEDNLINIQGVEGKVKASTIKKVEEIVANYPNETVAVIRSWMTQES